MASSDEASRREAASFPPEPSAVAAARAHVRSCLEHVPPEVVSDACLLVSELAGNAVLHARSPFRVEVVTADRLVRIDVTDRGGGRPSIREPRPEVGGLGLRLVETLASRWGTQTQGGE